LSEKWWKRKKRSHWDEFFEEFDKLEKMIDEMMNATFADSSTGQGRRSFSNPYVFGFSVSLGPDGKPRVRKFGTLQSTTQGSRFQEEREPLVDVMEDRKEIVIIAELPGIEKEDIKLDVTESSLTISVDTPERKYHRELFLPAKILKNSVRKRYKNGVLEVRLKKTRRNSFDVNKYSLSDY